MSKNSESVIDTDSTLQNARLQAVLQEVQFIRQEILDNIARMHKIEAGVVTMFVGLGALAATVGNFVPLLASPFLVLLFFGLWLPKQQHADRSSKYLLEEIEKIKWPQLLGERLTSAKVAGAKETPWRILWVGWQHYYDAQPPGFLWGCVPIIMVYVLGTATLAAGIIGIEFATDTASLDAKIKPLVQDYWGWLIVPLVLPALPLVIQTFLHLGRGPSAKRV